MTSRRLPLIIWLISGLLAACGAQPAAPTAALTSGVSRSVEGGTYTDITPAQLAEMLDASRKDFIFINTHIPYEGEIAQTGAFIPFEENGPQRVNEYPADKTTKIVLYCRSGRMSTIVAKELVKAGYTNVWNLDGGMIAWEKAGFELIRK
jgi:rhodanese-related sulfurtransferase